jgi:hypothetical protein
MLVDVGEADHGVEDKGIGGNAGREQGIGSRE